MKKLLTAFAAVIAILIPAAAFSATPALTVPQGGTGSSTLSGLLKGNGTSAVRSAVGNTDFQLPISLTTTGSSGAASFTGTTLNIPQYADTNTTYSATYPVRLTGTAFSLAFGTSTSNTWGGTQTFTSAPVLGSLTGLLKASSGSLTAASNGTDYTLITATTCSSGDFVSAVTASGVFTCSTPSGTGGSVAWGDITGTLSDQTDLQTALDAKAAILDLSSVAFSGSYDDLSNQPVIPVNTSDLVNDSGFLSAETDPVYSGDPAFSITTADLTHLSNLSGVNTGDQDLSGYALTSSLAAVATSGSYNDLTDTPSVLSSVAANYPLTGLGTSGSHLSLAFGTTTSNIWGGTQTFSSAPVLGSLTGLIKGSSGSLSAATNGTDYTLVSAQTCTNQVITALTAAGGSTCSTVSNAMLANSTISGISLGSNLANLSATNSTLTFSGTYNGGTARTIGLNLGNANTWTAVQTFSATSSHATSTFAQIGIGTSTPGSILAIQGVGNFVANAASTLFNSLRILGTLVLPSLATPAGSFLAVDPSGNVIATSTPSSGGTSYPNAQVFNSTGPVSYTDLDLSSAVGAAQHTVLLKVVFPSGGDVSFRRNGETASGGTQTKGTNVFNGNPNTGEAAYFITTTDTSGVVEWITNGGSFTVTVESYW